MRTEKEVERLVEDNQKLVYEMLNRCYINKVYDDDCVQRGLIGLWQAAKNYDESKGKFSTYACVSIYREISKYINSRFYRENKTTVCCLDEPAFPVSGQNAVYRVMETRLDELTDDETTEYTDAIESDMTAKQLLAGIAKRDTRCAIAVMYRINGKTLEETGQALGVSREYARQLLIKSRRFVPYEIRKEYIRV